MSNWTIRAGLKRLWASHQRRRSDRRTALALSQLDGHLLHDLGVEPQDVIEALSGGSAPTITFNPMRRR